MRTFLLTSFLAVTLVAASSARADSPGGSHEICDVEGLGCTSCYAGGLDQEPDAAPLDDYVTCSEAAKSKGLVDACHEHGNGGSTTVYFCPKGVTVEKKLVGGGCSAVDQRQAGGAVAAVLGVLGVLALMRRVRVGRR